MLGDTAIWRTDTAAEAQHALHFLCLKKNTHILASLLFCCLVLFTVQNVFSYIYKYIYIFNISGEMIIFHWLSFSHSDNRQTLFPLRGCSKPV